MEQTKTTDRYSDYFWRNSSLFSGIPNRQILVVTPYRNRENGLKELINYYSKKPEIATRWILLEQDNNRLFNLSRLLNIGYLIFAKESSSFYYVFHPLDGKIDRLRISNVHPITAYTFDSDFYAKTFVWKSETYRLIDGLNNLYEGWGTEDDEMFFRCGIHGVVIDRTNSGNYDLDDNSSRIRKDNHSEIFSDTLKRKTIYNSGLNSTGFIVTGKSNYSFLEHYQVTW